MPAVETRAVPWVSLRWMLRGLAAFQLIIGDTETRRAIWSYAAPPPTWMTGLDDWYEKAIQACLHGVVAVGCIVCSPRRGTWPRWRHWIEARVILDSVAVYLLLILPIGTITALVALQDDPPPWQRTFASSFPVYGIIFPVVGVAMIVYDRRPSYAGFCPTCRDNLTGNVSGVCPECGWRSRIADRRMHGHTGLGNGSRRSVVCKRGPAWSGGSSQLGALRGLKGFSSRDGKGQVKQVVPRSR